MLKFAYLSGAQKKCVVALLDHTPALKKKGQITLAEITTITQELAAGRDAGGVKIGYPNWLMKANKIERGLYELPIPTADELKAYRKDEKTPAPKQVVAKKVKVAKVKTVTKAAPVAETDSDEDTIAGSRLVRAIEEAYDDSEDDEDFNAILRENGITV